DVTVHPWLPDELAQRFGRAGLHWLGARDRTVQFGPKIGDERYWPGLPRLRPALGRLLAGDPSCLGVLAEPLPPLPVGPTAALHHGLAERRGDLVRAGASLPAHELAERLWELEPATGSGHGHGLVALGRVA
ncbi:MAG: hypothetical protein H0T15_01820, partial [Thermoleophilaceae bacterium]|nr:hypothetical protein [Thermoleophilaceae bacterium]